MESLYAARLRNDGLEGAEWRELSDGLRDGDLGSVVGTYDPEGLDVEFVTASGRTQALVTLHNSDVRRVIEAVTAI